jgi:type II secretory pathway component PulC
VLASKPMIVWMLATVLAAVVAAGPPADLTVVGTIVSPRSDRGVAMLRSAGRTRTAAAGETAFGGRIVSVGPGLVTMEFGPERVQLRLAGIDATAPPPAVPAPDAATESPRAMARADVERRLGAEIPKILAETTVVPYLERGEVAGLLVSRMPDGLLSEVGLRAGDVLQSVNEVPVDSVATLASLWPRFQNATEVRAVVLRDGRPFSLTLALR